MSKEKPKKVKSDTKYAVVNFGIGSVAIQHRLHECVGFITGSYSLALDKLSKLERTQLRRAFQQDYLKAAPGSRVADIYQLLCRIYSLKHKIFSPQFKCVMSWAPTMNVVAFKEAAEAVFGVVPKSNAALKIGKGADVNTHPSLGYMTFNSPVTMTPEAFMAAVGRELFPSNERTELDKALAVVAANGSLRINFSMPKAASEAVRG